MGDVVTVHVRVPVWVKERWEVRARSKGVMLGTLLREKLTEAAGTAPSDRS